MDINENKMNSTSTCLYNKSTCYFIDSNSNCLSDDIVLDMISKSVIPTYQEWICIILYVIVFIVGTIGNLLVIIVIQRNRSMRTVTNMFIMNLAAADLLVLVFCLPATVVQDVTKTWFFGLALCKFVNYVQNMSVSVSVLTLMAISIERYQAIVHPLKFSGTKQRARILILSVWILSILLVLPDAIMMTLTQQFSPRLQTIYLTYCQWNAPPLFDLIYQLHISLCLFVIPLCFMVFTYRGIAKVLWGSLPMERFFNDEKRAINSSQHTLSGQSDESHHSVPINSSSSLMNPAKSANLIVQENRQKAAKMLISVVIIFAICYIPVHVFNLFRYIFVYLEHSQHSIMNDQQNSTDSSPCFQPVPVALDQTNTVKVVTICALISHFLPFLNSSINPIIYNIMSDKFRLKFRELFSSCCCCCKSFIRMKSASSTMIPFRASTTIPYGSQQPSPTSTANNNHHQNHNRCHLNNKHKRLGNNSLNLSTASVQLLTNSNSTNMTKHSVNSYGHNGSIAFRLTNV
ncbi:unnamed protein product [Adineta ricciae]|uniref:G-protein coupled receptors family 1 profile domain-containing protein n=1 Tax=Adineta ricciae TaxID=249248 RepID=A0A813NAU8_ADIRI|nr:unnamed protein product [Adineta ricciae]CAF0917744.1 unnamed protein product [Adineta ricciae]